MNARTSRTPLVLLAALLVTGPALADPVGNRLSGTISDWPAGQTGEVRVGPAQAPVASAPVDAQGHFDLILPATLPSSNLSPVRGVLGNPSSYGGANCQGAGTAEPRTAGFQTFRFGAYGPDGRALSGELVWATTNQNARQDGSVWADLWYLDATTTFDAVVTCPGRTDTVTGRFSQGWNVAVFEKHVDAQTGAVTQAVASAPLPGGMTWYLYRETVGLGLGLGQPSARGLPVVQVLAGQAAERAGVQVGDLITEVDGQNVTALTTYQVTQLLRGGPVGSTVDLTVRRGAGGDLLTLHLTRVLLRL